MISKLIDTIKPFIVMEVLEKASEMEKNGIDIIHFEVGEPDFDIPKKIIESSNIAIRNGNTHYTHSLGDFELRKTISEYYNKTYQLKTNPENIVVSSGSSPAILLVLGALLNPGDEVIISNPGYACYSNFIKFTQGKVVEVPVNAANGFQYLPEKIAEKITNKTKAIIINSPMNPTGNLLQPETMEAIAKLGPMVISDEIYHALVYNDKAHSILEYTNNAFVISGFSKAYAMTGLRLGYCICPDEFIRPIQKLQQNLFICASSVAQKCGITALNDCNEDLSLMKTIYNERRIYMVRRLKELGFKIPIEPTGAFYVFVNCKHLSRDSYKLAFDILDKAHIGVTPGIDFGSNGEGFLRFSYANSIENIEEGLDRLDNYLHKYYP
ncbi:MAG: pyridoxal phosphate-dependent aminotransferase [Prolixibacteraceae bacterium]|jgi:aspartate/methionine/tyrosine aminotransferase|nr:pyridoxal phosphate-dependent aminotransferase [Prolixibacteraceae bacterium]